MEFLHAIETGCNTSWIETVVPSFAFQLLLLPASIQLKNSPEIILCYVICYVIWLFVKSLSQEAIQRRSQRDRLVKIKVFKLRRDADDIPYNITLRSAGGESFHSTG